MSIYRSTTVSLFISAATGTALERAARGSASSISAGFDARASSDGSGRHRSADDAARARAVHPPDVTRDRRVRHVLQDPDAREGATAAEEFTNGARRAGRSSFNPRLARLRADSHLPHPTVSQGDADKMARKLAQKEAELDMLQVANEALQAQAKVRDAPVPPKRRVERAAVEPIVSPSSAHPPPRTPVPADGGRAGRGDQGGRRATPGGARGGARAHRRSRRPNSGRGGGARVHRRRIATTIRCENTRRASRRRRRRRREDHRTPEKAPGGRRRGKTTPRERIRAQGEARGGGVACLRRRRRAVVIVAPG